MYQDKKQQGFTLVETMIATTVFSFVAIGVMAIFAQMVLIQRSGSHAQRIQENVQYVLELMAREIRISTLEPNQDADCASVTASSLTIQYPTGGGATTTVVYSSTAAGIVQRTAGGSAEDVSSADVVFTKLGFCIQGSADDSQQPRVAIVVAVKDVRDTNGEQTMHIQTTVIPRKLDLF